MTSPTGTPEAPVWTPRPNAENPTIVLSCGCEEGGASDFHVLRLESRPDLKPPGWRRTWNRHARRHVDPRLLADADNAHETLVKAAAVARTLYDAARQALEDQKASELRGDDLARKRTNCLRKRFQEEIDTLARLEAAA